ARQSAGIYHRHSAGLAAIAARKHVEADAAGLEQFAEQDDEGRFPGTADRQVADADHRPFQPPGRESASVVQRIAQAYRAAKYSREDARGHQLSCCGATLDSAAARSDAA